MTNCLIAIVAIHFISACYVPVHAQFMNYDPFSVGMADNWKAPFAKFTLRWGSPSSDEHQWFYECEGAEFSKLKRLSNCPGGSCPERVVFKVRSSSDIAHLRSVLLKGGSETVRWAIGFGAGLTPYGAAYDVLTFLLEQSQSVKNYKSATGSLDVLIARGGEVVYEERLTSSSGYWLTRSIFYRIRVGDELRIIPLWVATLPAHIK